jgi:hypothetical protein
MIPSDHTNHVLPSIPCWDIPNYLGSSHTNYIIFRNVENFKNKLKFKYKKNFKIILNPKEYSVYWNENFVNQLNIQQTFVKAP